MKVFVALVVLGLVCFTAQGASWKKAKQTNELRSLELKLRGLLESKIVHQKRASTVATLLAIEKGWKEIVETVPGVEEKLQEIENAISSKIGEGVEVADVIALLPEGVEYAYGELSALIGDKIPDDVSEDMLKLFIKMHICLSFDFPSIEAAIEEKMPGLEEAIMAAFDGFDPKAIESHDDFEESYEAILAKLEPAFEAFADALPEEFNNIDDIITIIIQFHIRIGMLRPVIVAHVPGIQEEIYGAIDRALFSGMPENMMAEYVGVRAGLFMCANGPRDLFDYMSDSKEGDEILTEMFWERIGQLMEAGKLGKRTGSKQRYWRLGR